MFEDTPLTATLIRVLFSASLLSFALPARAQSGKVENSKVRRLQAYALEAAPELDGRPS